MANQPKGKSPEPQGGAEFVRHIVKDPANVPDVMRLYGYLGASSEKGYERLYLNPDLSFYVEVPIDAVLHRMAVPASQDSYGASILWVRQDAQLKQKATPAANALAHYFAGALQAAAGPQAQPVQHFGHTTHQYCPPTNNCAPSQAACGPSVGCPPETLPAVCVTTPHVLVCPTEQPVTTRPHCDPALNYGLSQAAPCWALYQLQMQPSPVCRSLHMCDTGPRCVTGAYNACVTPRNAC